MFTGLVSDVGTVRSASHRDGLLRLEIATPLTRDLSVGESIAVGGVCLTVVRSGRRRFATEVMGETIARTTLGTVRRGSRVNLEPPLRLSDRLGGHLVQGHVDAVGEVADVARDAGSSRLRVSVPEGLTRYMIPKGSVAVDGVSLTIVSRDDASFTVALIPHTLEVTTLRDLEVGSKVNIEVDQIAKYVEQLAFADR